VMAVYCTWHFLEVRRSAWWMGGVAGVALFLATLQYSPARLVVLVLLGVALPGALWQWRRLDWRRGVGLLLLVLVGTGVGKLEKHFGRQSGFLYARGEQFFALVDTPQSIEPLFGKKLLHEPRDARQMTLADKVELMRLILETTVPQYRALVTPAVD